VTPSIVTVRDIDVSVERVGAGKPLVVCGGPQLGHRYLRPLDVLSDSYELFYFDARGSGDTELGDPSELSFTGAIADLDGLCSALGLERVTLLGHSLGGHVAYLFASTYPDRVAALILVDVGPPFAEDQAGELGNAMVSARTADDDAKLREIEESAEFQQRQPEAVEAYILNVYTPFFRDRRSVEAADLGFTPITAANVLEYEERLVMTLSQADPVTSLAKVRCPTLVVHGELDPIPVAFSRFIAESIPGAEFALMPGASHFPFIEDAEEFERTVRAFLTRVTGDSDA